MLLLCNVKFGFCYSSSCFTVPVGTVTVVLLPTDLTDCWSVVWLVDAAGVGMEPAMNVLLSAASSFSR